MEEQSHTPIDNTPNITILGEGHDEWGQRYFRFAIARSGVNIPPFSAARIVQDPKPLFAALTNAGANLFTHKAKNELLAQLQSRQPEPDTFQVVTKLGWSGTTAYVSPHEVVGQAELPLEPDFHDLDPQMLLKYRVKGTLEEWQKNIASLCVGNSRLMFAVSLACTGPILPLVSGPRGGGFQFSGPAETGKTTAAMVAGSFWGCHSSARSDQGFTESWHSTAGKVELTALAHNDALLILDETKRAGRDAQARAQAVVDVSFGLAERTEKDRLTNAGSVRSWRLYFLSTSNYTLAELARRGRVEVDAAVLGRLFDVPCPEKGRGIYEQLHGFVSGEKLTDVLKVRCRKYFGSASRALVRQLVADHAADSAGLKKFLRTERQAYLDALKPKVDAEGFESLSRVSGRCATVFAAGSLAIKYGILPWPRDQLVEGILACQLAGLQVPKAAVGKVSASVAAGALREKLVGYLRDHQDQFLLLGWLRPTRASHQLGQVPGYLAKFKGDIWFYLTDDQLGAIIGTDTDAKELKTQLISEGLMASSKRGFVVQRKIFRDGKGNKGWAWVCAFKAAILK
jgi:putative DNA primase/helicase